MKNYQFRKVIGKGGFGAVYRATCTRDDGRKVDVAVKIMKKKLLEDAKLVDRVLKEIEIQWQLEHPNIARLYTYFEDPKYVFLVTELCGNGELFRYIKALKRPLSEPEARGVLLQLLDALEYLHRRGVVHRDLKLSNVLLFDDMTIRLADFGLASRLADPTVEQHTEVICGTPNYLPPEMLNGQFGMPSDIWGLGCMLITMLTGTPPFQGTGGVESTFENVRTGNYTLDSRHQISAEAKSLIKLLLQLVPGQRPKLEQVRAHRFFNPLLQVEPLKAIGSVNVREKQTPIVLAKDQSSAASERPKAPSVFTTATSNGEPSTVAPSERMHSSAAALGPVYLTPLKEFALARRHCKLRLIKANKPVLFAYFFGDTECFAVGCSKDELLLLPWESVSCDLETCAESNLLAKLSSGGTRVSLKNLEKRWLSRYLYVYSVVNVLASKVPEVMLQTNDCKSMLMSNRPDADFHMVFRDGVKVHAFINKKKVEIKVPDGKSDAKVFVIDLKSPELSSIYLPDPAVSVFILFQQQLVLCLKGLERFSKRPRPGEPLKLTVKRNAETDKDELVCINESSINGRREPALVKANYKQLSASSSSSSLTTLVSTTSHKPANGHKAAVSEPESTLSSVSKASLQRTKQAFERYTVPTKWISSPSIGWFTKLVDPNALRSTGTTNNNSSSAKSEASASSSNGSGFSAASGWTLHALAKDKMGLYLCLFHDGTRITVDPLTQTVQQYGPDDQVKSYPIQKEKLPPELCVKVGQFSLLLRKFFNYKS